MEYLEAVNLLRQIENKYDVMSIRYKGISVWPHLRVYLVDSISTKSEVKASGSVIKVVLKSLFSYNPLKLLKKYDVWLVTGAERRKKVGDKMVHRISGGFCQVDQVDVLMLEKPSSSKGHPKNCEVEEKNIVSMSAVLVLEHVLMALFKKNKPKIENEELLIKILKENNIQFNYNKYINTLNAQRLAMKVLIMVSRKPKVVFMECPYTMMGFVWQFHKKCLKVVELQHGVLNKNHYAYNAKQYESALNPDGICVFGIEEYEYFIKKYPQYVAQVCMVGLYMLERADASFITDIFAEEKKKYKYIVVASGQTCYEEQLAAFVCNVAKLRKDILFLYIPRNNDVELFLTEDNVRMVKEVNIYEYLKWADVNMTVSSTTCLEAHYFHTPTIFFDYNRMAISYYGNVLKTENAAEYITKVQEFDAAFAKVLNGNHEFREIFSHHHVERLNECISEMITYKPI